MRILFLFTQLQPYKVRSILVFATILKNVTQQNSCCLNSLKCNVCLHYNIRIVCQTDHKAVCAQRLITPECCTVVGCSSHGGTTRLGSPWVGTDHTDEEPREVWTLLNTLPSHQLATAPTQPTTKYKMLWKLYLFIPLEAKHCKYLKEICSAGLGPFVKVVLRLGSVLISDLVLWCQLGIRILIGRDAGNSNLHCIPAGLRWVGAQQLAEWSEWT